MTDFLLGVGLARDPIHAFHNAHDDIKKRFNVGMPIILKWVEENCSNNFTFYEDNDYDLDIVTTSIYVKFYNNESAIAFKLRFN